MSINHFPTDIPEPLWWSQQQNQTMGESESNPKLPPKDNRTSWPPSSFHWLNPPQPHQHQHHHPNLNLNDQISEVKDYELETKAIEKEPMFEKPLTPSDVGKLNRLVIPKQHAEKYFPLSGDSVEKGLLLSFEDESGKCWRFRYSYWNSSQSYVLTKGWSRYVKEKQLDAGDVVSFERHRIDGERLFIGWRRRGDNSNNNSSSSSGGGGMMMVQGNSGGAWSRGLHHPYQHNVTARVPYQPECLHAAEQKQTIPIGNSKRLRLFGVNMECQLDESEPSTPDGSSSMSSQGQTQHNFYTSHMDINLSRDINQMRNRRG